MSAAGRVPHAAETIRAAWDLEIKVNPQTDAAQALEDAGQLLDPEVAAELTGMRGKQRRLAEAEAENAELRQRVAELEAERAKYVGKEPTVAEEMAYLGRCLDAVYDACDAAERQAARWEHPLPVPEWVATVRQAADGERPDDPDDRRRRIYLDGRGQAWIDACEDNGIKYIAEIDISVDIGEPPHRVRQRTGSLREIGRTW